MITKKFHQYIVVVRGAKNSLISDFLKKNVYAVENEIIDKFFKGEYSEIENFLGACEQEEMLISVDDVTWVPPLQLNMDNLDREIDPILEIEEGADLQIIKKKLSEYRFQGIFYFGDNKPKEILPYIPHYYMEKNFQECEKNIEITELLEAIEEHRYIFNRNFNPCWGKKIAVTKDMKIRPCIYSELLVGDLLHGNMEEIFESIKEYWLITKDKIETCKDCERRYNCFDCREISRKSNGNLYAKHHACKYNPYTGCWSE